MHSRRTSRRQHPLHTLSAGPAATQAAERSCCTYTAGTRSYHPTLICRLTLLVRSTLCSVPEDLFAKPPKLIHYSAAFDKQAMLLYVTLHQVFSIQFLPFHKSHVSLTTVLHLTKLQTFPTETSSHEVKASQRIDGCSRYYITSQNDLYQTSEFVKFVLPWFGLGTIGVMLWQFTATFFCIVGAVLGWPITWLEEKVSAGNKERRIRDILGRE